MAVEGEEEVSSTPEMQHAPSYRRAQGEVDSSGSHFLLGARSWQRHGKGPQLSPGHGDT